ncbi:MAG TPA: pirin family protein, partial [Cyclobacteriaceae bacterium]|nr:pirin family protein [Cyclobacteriaceae bacterium]
PKERNIKPRYDQKLYPASERENKFQTVVAPDKTDGALWINQDAWFSLGNFQKGTTVDYALRRRESGVYVFVIDGSVTINGQLVNRRDGYGLWETDSVSLVAQDSSEVLLMEVPMMP